MYTDKTARYLAHNVAYFARLLREHPIPTSLKALVERARAHTGDECPPSHGSE